jgi:hypothetical protein
VAVQIHGIVEDRQDVDDFTALFAASAEDHEMAPFAPRTRRLRALVDPGVPAFVPLLVERDQPPPHRRVKQVAAAAGESRVSQVDGELFL